MKTKKEILHLLTLYKPTAESKYGLTRIGIFGSVARGEQTEDSDVDGGRRCSRSTSYRPTWSGCWAVASTWCECSTA